MREVEVATDEPHRMAERDQVGRALGRHHARQPRHRQHVALAARADRLLDQAQRRGLHANLGRGDRLAQRLGLGRDVDHPRPTARVRMREPGPGHVGAHDSAWEPASSL